MIIKKEIKNKVTIYYVEKEITDEKMENLKNTYVKKSQINLIIDHDADVYNTENNKLLLKFRKNKLSVSKITDFYENVIHFAMGYTNNRGSTSGSKKKNVHENPKIMTNIIGYFDKLSPMQKYLMKKKHVNIKTNVRECRFNVDYPEKYKKLIPLVEEVDYYYKKYVPDNYTHQYKKAKQTPFRITNTCFTTITTNTLDELENAPDEPTIIFIKDKCRMGKEVPKQHIVFCIETAISSNADTILQGLLGRMCGYLIHDIDIYIYQDIIKEIETYIRFCEGGSIIPSKAMNIIPPDIKNTTNSAGGNAIIPLKINAETLNITSYNDRDDRNLLVDTVLEHLNSGNVINKNGETQSQEIIEKANRLPISAFKIRRIENANISYADTPKRLYDSFSTGTPNGPGTSVNVPSHGEEFSLLYFSQAYPEYDIERGCVFIYTTTKSRPALSDEDVFRYMPKTNKNEMFCRKPEELIVV